MSDDTGRVLVIDDDASVGRFLASELEGRAHEVFVFTDSDDALRSYETIAPDVVIVDLWLQGTDGLHVIAEVLQRDPSASIILLSGNVDVRTTVRALRAGAEDVLTKPVDLDLLCEAIDRGLQRSRLIRVHRVARTQVSDPYGFFDESPMMRRVVRLIEGLAQITTPVLIVGEPGTGKGVMAEMLHQLSPRAGKPFVRVPCARRTEQELYDALAGPASGGNTGAIATARGGTLYLGGMAELPRRVQELLLSALTADSPSSGSGAPAVRFIASTSRDLAADVDSGALGPELFRRLAVLPLAVPSLRARGDVAIRSLATRSLQAQRQSLGRGPVRLSDEAAALLVQFDWPGNVRQLRQVIEESFIGGIGAETLEPMHLRDALERTGLGRPTHMEAPDDRSLSEVERRHIARILALTGGHRTEAAKILGITRTTLYKKMYDYGLDKIGGE